MGLLAGRLFSQPRIKHINSLICRSSYLLLQTDRTQFLATCENLSANIAHVYTPDASQEPRRSFTSIFHSNLCNKSVGKLWQRKGLANGGGRTFATADDLRTNVGSSIDEAQYSAAADEALEDLQEKFEIYLEDLGFPNSDVEYGQGVLTVRLGSKGTYVINKQAPNKQIWLSSPVSGPFRYDLVDGAWIYNRDGHILHKKLEKEIEQLCGTPFQL